MDDTKVCCKCQRELPMKPEYFHRNRHKKDGFIFRCKECSGFSFTKESKQPRKGYKICTGCKEEKRATEEEFHIQKNGLYGLKAKCRKCVKEYRDSRKHIEREQKRKLRIEKGEELNRKNREYYRRNREKVLYKQKKYNYANKEKRKKYYEEYRKEHPDRVKKSQRGYYLKHKDRYIQSTLRRRARQNELEHNFTSEQWDFCKKHFDYKCAYCEKETKLELEHFIPLTRDGELTKNNIIPACRSCNSSKNDNDFFEWFSKQKFYSKQRERKILKYLNYNKNKEQQLALL